MKHLLLAAFVITSLFLPLKAQSSCEECPFPLIHVTGDWRSSDGNYTIRIREMARDMEQWGAAVWLVDSKGKVVATGTAVTPHASTRIDVHLVYTNGSKKRLILQADFRNREQLVLRSVVAERIQPCSGTATCDRLTKIRPKSAGKTDRNQSCGF